MKSWSKYLAYASLIFLLIALKEGEYLTIPQIYSPLYLAISFAFLFFSFLSGAICWQRILRKNGIHAPLKECLASVGLSVFSKYLPGKIWSIMGRAVYIAEKKSFPLHQVSSISLDAQLLTLWLGLIFGAFGLFLLDGIRIWGWLILLLWIGLTAIIFWSFPRSSAEWLLKKIFKKDVVLPHLSPKSIFSILPWFIVYWILWTVSFYMLVISLTSIDVPLSVGLGFPLAGTLGIMAIVVPGGLGVREGVLVAFLSLAGLPISLATTISIAARLWYLIGEVVIFLVGWMADSAIAWSNDKKNHMRLRPH